MKMAKNSLWTTANKFSYFCYNVVIVLVLIVSNFHIQCGPSAQQEQELLLLDALSRKQSLNSNLNAISTNINSNNHNNYESNTIMDMLGRSMLFKFHIKKINKEKMFIIFCKTKNHQQQVVKEESEFSTFAFS